MAEIPKLDDVIKLVSFLAPGILILGVRSRFRDPSSSSDITTKIVSFTLASIAYSAAANPVFHAHGGLALPGWLWELLLSAIVPVLIGLCLAYIDISESFYEAAERLGLKPAHHVQTAWDYIFPRATATYVLIHLNDDSVVAGVWERGSFVSSVAGERDLFISRLYALSAETGSWSEVDPPRSMLICGGTIRMIEFIKGTQNG